MFSLEERSEHRSMDQVQKAANSTFNPTFIAELNFIPQVDTFRAQKPTSTQNSAVRRPILNATKPKGSKSGLATSFLIHAINQGYSGRYVLFAELLAQFYRSCADHSEAKLLSKYLSYDCLFL